MKSTSNPMLPSVLTSFENLPEEGKKHQYQHAHMPYGIKDHIQGMAIYGDYIILSHNRENSDKGYIAIIDRDQNKVVHRFDTPDEGYEHPGGLQVVGDYLVVGIEDDHGDKSIIRFFDISGLGGAVYALEMPYAIKRPDKSGNEALGRGGAEATGITAFMNQDNIETYVVAVYDNGVTDFYVSNGKKLSDTDCAFSLKFRSILEHTGYQNIGLLTQSDNTIWMIGFDSPTSGVFDLSFSDLGYLYQIDLDAQTVTRKGDRKHFTTKHAYGETTKTGVHFRYGAGLRVYGEKPVLQLYASERNADPTTGGLHTNTFTEG